MTRRSRELQALPPVDRKALAAYLRGLADQHTKDIAHTEDRLRRLPWWRRRQVSAGNREHAEFHRGAAINLASVAWFVETGDDSRTRRSLRARILDLQDVAQAYRAEHGAGCECGPCRKAEELLDERD